MPDRLSTAQRSRLMAAVKSRDTSPEIVVRRLSHQLGFRFRLHCRDLPGTPDLVFPRLKSIINVHGCFWHLHACQRGRKDPVANAVYWQQKRERNARRDRAAARRLKRLGWRVLVVWECETRSTDKLKRRLADFLCAANRETCRPELRERRV